MIPCLRPSRFIMHQKFKSYTLLSYLIATGLFLFTHSGHSLAANEKRNSNPIVVTIKPLYSLVANLTEGIEQPVLLMKQAQSPHHYNMRPSERRLLASAKMIIWLGPQMESYLSKIITQQQNTTMVVSALQAKNLTLLEKRQKHSHDGEQAAITEQQELHAIDPHIWLSTHNVAEISKYFTRQLISQDPKNTDVYNKNLQQLLIKIGETRNFIKTALTASDAPFITFHDAFQYFENENNLNYVDAINFDDETGTSLKHLRRIKNHIDRDNIQCLVYQQPKPAIVSQLSKQTAIKAVALDPLGLNLANDKNLWFELMRQLALNFNQCLTADGDAFAYLSLHH